MAPDQRSADAKGEANVTGKLSGKVVVITGAASGIGESTARMFSREGAKLVIADRQVRKGEALARELGNAAFAKTDVTREADIAAAVDLAVGQFGRLDCMINNAGLAGATGSLIDLTADAWAATISVLLTGVFYGIKHSARIMVGQKSGCILSTSSVAGVAGGLGAHAYTAAKHGVTGLMRSAASEFAEHGIRVNAVAPGNVPTPLTASVVGGSMEQAEKVSAGKSMMGDMIVPDEIAAGFLYLASDDARHVTGHTLVIDAGRSGFFPRSATLHAPGMNFYDGPPGAK